MLPEIGLRYYFFGSKDSRDIDVLIEYPVDDIELNVQLITKLKTEYPIPANWNFNLIRIADGVISQSIASKGNPDGVNNSLYETYHLHKQRHPFPLSSKLPRNILDAIHRCLEAILTFYKNTDNHKFYQDVPRKVLVGGRRFLERVEVLSKFDFEEMKPFLDETENIEKFKKIAFHIGQTISLIDGIEIYTKQELVYHHPELVELIKRENNPILSVLNIKLNVLADKIIALGITETENRIVKYKGWNLEY